MNWFILDRVAFTIGTLDVYWYGIILASAIFLAYILVNVLCKKLNRSSSQATEMFIAAVVPGILNARLFSVLFESGSSIKDYFSFRDGGMSIIGAVIGGAIGLGILSLIRKKNYFEYADIVAPLLILGQAIGRWGNYFNQEVYGKVVENEAWQWFPFAVYIEAEGQWFHALFFYESVLNLIGFSLLITLLFKVKKRGIVTGVYLMWYGVVRFIMESMRSSQYILKFVGMPISKLLAGVMFFAGLAIIVTIFVLDKLKKRKDNTTVNLMQ